MINFRGADKYLSQHYDPGFVVLLAGRERRRRWQKRHL